MTTVTRLFFKRLINEWKFQFSVWRTAVDWTVALYIVIPTLYFLIKMYADWWKVQPAWLSYLPFSSFALILLLFILKGDIRVFLEEADQLFLYQKGSWINRLRKLSIAYSIILNLFATCLLFIVLAPLLLISYKLSIPQLIMWSFFCALLKSVTALNKRLVSIRYYGWRQGFVRWIIYLLIGIYYRASLFLLTHQLSLFTLNTFILLISLTLLIHRYINLKKGSFLKEVDREQNLKLRYASLLLQAGLVYTNKSKTLTINNRPWLFSHSNPLFKERNAGNLLAEVCFKSVLRNRTHLVIYGQLIVLCMAIVLSFPLEWKWVIWLGFALILTKFVELFWLEMKNSEFVQMFPWKHEDLSKAAEKALFFLMILGFLPISFAFGMQLYSWLGALAVMLVGGVIGYYTAKAVATFV